MEEELPPRRRIHERSCSAGRGKAGDNGRSLPARLWCLPPGFLATALFITLITLFWCIISRETFKGKSFALASHPGDSLVSD